MAVPLLTKKVVKKRSAKFIRPQNNRRITVKVTTTFSLNFTIVYFCNNLIFLDMFVLIWFDLLHLYLFSKARGGQRVLILGSEEISTLMPNVSYGSDKKTHLSSILPNGVKKFNVHKTSELELLMMHKRTCCQEIAHKDQEKGHSG